MVHNAAVQVQSSLVKETQKSKVNLKKYNAIVTMVEGITYRLVTLQRFDDESIPGVSSAHCQLNPVTVHAARFTPLLATLLTTLLTNPQGGLVSCHTVCTMVHASPL